MKLLIIFSLACALLIECNDAFLTSIGKSGEELPRTQNDFLHIFTIISILSQPVLPAEATMTDRSFTNDSVQIVSSYKLSESAAFKLLPREMQKSTAMKKLQDLKDLQDDRLAQCADRGVYWEQCFMFGESESGIDAIGKVVTGKGDDSLNRNGIDYQLISPIGALNPPTETKKIPTW